MNLLKLFIKNICHGKYPAQVAYTSGRDATEAQHMQYS